MHLACATPDAGDGQMTKPTHCNVLMIYPRFSAGSFWNYSITAELFGARYPTIPLGLITLAAMFQGSGRSASSIGIRRPSTRPTSTGLISS